MQNNIRVERAVLHITQDDLAKQLGVSRQTIHSVETGKYIPSTVLAFKMAAFFGKPVEELFQLEPGD
jgi:putative transcriptional regulator